MNIPVLLPNSHVDKGRDSQMLYSLKGTTRNQEVKLTGRLMHVIYKYLPLSCFFSFLSLFFLYFQSHSMFICSSEGTTYGVRAPSHFLYSPIIFHSIVSMTIPLMRLGSLSTIKFLLGCLIANLDFVKMMRNCSVNTKY